MNAMSCAESSDLQEASAPAIFASDAGDFPAGDCASCARLVIAYRTYDDGDLDAPPVLRCIHCDGALCAVEALPLDALEEQGYGFVDGGDKKGGCATSGACSLTGKKVAGPGLGGCNGGDCTKTGPLLNRRA